METCHSQDFDDRNSNMPWDEARQSSNMPWDEADGHNEMGNAQISEPSPEWRRYGQMRRKQILEEDRRRGGTNFDLNVSCSVYRYFQVAQRALEQFHKMQRDGAGLEETYIVGNRLVCFLTECLPAHPDFRTREVSDLRRRNLKELERLIKSLEDIALKIDEDQCNKFVADYDPVIADDDDDDDDDDSFGSLSAKQSNDWVAFGSWKDTDGPRKVESPTADTVGTTGTGSFEAFELYSSDESISERRLDFSGYEDLSPKPLRLEELSTDFLERIAQEDVTYETDSEAADSWAQDSEIYCPSASSGANITCDPARLAFRELMNRVPRSNLLSRYEVKASDKSPPEKHARRPDPPASVLSVSSVRAIETEIQRFLEEPEAVDKEQAVESEIQRYLDSSGEEDPDSFFDSSMEKLKDTSPARSFCSSRSSSSSSSPFRSLTLQNRGNIIFKEDLDQVAWVSFDDQNKDGIPFKLDPCWDSNHQ